uniref:Putative disease resistance protein At3g14460 n=1 Tax=Rhizophora mucronata TaxID=61149 RepID=A0A2P2NWU4_RHIMU
MWKVEEAQKEVFPVLWLS